MESRSVRFTSHAELILSASDLPPPGAQSSDNQSFGLPTLAEDIVAVDAAIAATSLAEKSYESKRLDVEQNHENTISPQHHIPPEIWSEIFLYGHSLDSDEDPFDWPSRTIWRLSQVCQTWRNLALSLHSCWASIILEFPCPWKASEMDVELLALILERSHQHLLDITLSDRSHGGTDKEELSFQYRMRDMVFSQSHRWRTARLISTRRAKSEKKYAFLQGRMSQLAHLDLQILECMNDSTAVISAFKDCPHLVNVSFTGSNPRMFELPVKKLTSLRLCNLSPQWRVYSVELLSQCPLLKTLHVDFVLEQSELAWHPSKSPTLPRLRELSATHPIFIDALTVPRLEVAALNRQPSHFYFDTLFSFYSLVRRSNCASNLTELRIVRVSLTLYPSEPHLLLAILNQTTKLATLQLEVSLLDHQQDTPDEWSITQVMDVMSALQGGDSVNFLPRLVSLDIEVTGHTDLTYVPYLKPFDDFVCMLRARRLEKFGFSLQTCYDGNRRPDTVHDGTVFDEYEISVLRGLVGDGLSMDIHFEGVLCFEL